MDVHWGYELLTHGHLTGLCLTKKIFSAALFTGKYEAVYKNGGLTEGICGEGELGLDLQQNLRAYIRMEDYEKACVGRYLEDQVLLGGTTLFRTMQVRGRV